MTWRKIIKRLHSYHLLQDNWDGDGAVAPSSQVVCGAIAVAAQCVRDGRRPPARVSPGVNGTIYFEWIEPGCYIEAEVVAVNEVEVRTHVRGEKVTSHRLQRRKGDVWTSIKS